MRRPALTRLSESALNPLIGKSLVIYAKKKTQVIPNVRVVPPGATLLAGTGQAHVAG